MVHLFIHSFAKLVRSLRSEAGTVLSGGVAWDLTFRWGEEDGRRLRHCAVSEEAKTVAGGVRDAGKRSGPGHAGHARRSPRQGRQESLSGEAASGQTPGGSEKVCG